MLLALKAQNETRASLMLAFRLTVAISRLQRFKTRRPCPGALPQAFTFRAFGAGKLALAQPLNRREAN